VFKGSRVNKPAGYWFPYLYYLVTSAAKLPNPFTPFPTVLTTLGPTATSPTLPNNCNLGSHYATTSSPTFGLIEPCDIAAK